MASVEWGKYRIDDLFKIQTSAKRFDANKVNIIENGRYPYVVRTSSNNGQKGFLDENESFLNAENTISFGQDTATIFYQEKPYFTGDKIKVLVPKVYKFNKKNAQFFLASMNIAFSKFSWGSSRFNVDVLKVDMGFIKETKNVKKSRIILASVIKMAKELNLLIITEGVETEEQVDNLTKLGCDVFQGYYFSKAIDVNEFEKRYLYRKKAG